MSKTFKHASRADAQSIDPLHLCIVGGKALPEEERGPLDTDPDPRSPLHAHDLLKPLDPRDVDDIFEQGVIVPIEVVRVKVNGVDIPMVNLGRGRVRKARRANIRRKKEGLPLLEVKFIVVRLTEGLQLFRRATAENLRRKTLGLLDQIELAKQYLGLGASEEVAAREIGIPRSRFEKLLVFEDNATPAVKEALRQDRLSASAGFVLAEIEDPVEMDKKLAELLTAPKPTVRAARQLQRGKTDEPTPPRRPELKKLLERLDPHTRGDEWMQGARAALRWAVDGTLPKPLAKILETAEEEEVASTSKKKTS